MAVAESKINELMESAEVEEFTVFDKCLVVCYKLSNGFILVESSACVDPKDFDTDIGRDICKNKIRDKLWELEGYLEQNKVKKSKGSTAANPELQSQLTQAVLAALQNNLSRGV